MNLIEATADNDLPTMYQLLLAGVTPHFCEDWCRVTPLHIAVQNRSPAAVLILLLFGADPLRPEFFGETPMDIAKLFYDNTVWKLLCYYKAIQQKAC